MRMETYNRKPRFEALEDRSLLTSVLAYVARAALVTQAAEVVRLCS
jgi:hypothetical protein